MSIQIGINPLTWSNDDLPELGGQTPLETCLSEAGQAGYAGIELGNKFPRKAPVLKPLLRQYRLQLISGWYSARLLERSAADELTALESHLRLLQALDCRVMVFAEVSGAVHGQRETPLSARPVMSDGEWGRFTDRINTVAEGLRAKGMALAYHHHMGTVIQSAAEVERLLANTGDAVGLLLDTGHLAYAGGDPVQIAKWYAGRIQHVHCKDVRPQVLQNALEADSPFLEAVLAGVFTVPGDGCVDFSALLPVLKNADYEGWLVVEAEQDPSKADPLTYARMGYDYLALQAAEAGWKP